ncbi:terminase gpP N-terminus-related DNA-binding protein, partial [Cupriavidus pinatubonensis]|uniref:terminase gpP N-terminus-related DNA-binding protein n=1 Tax=Cupriavidus pinatubonensis TaxID=248026 RepID=UPI004037CCF5
MTMLPPLAFHSFDPEMEPRRIARALYWQGYRVARVAEMLGVKPVTVHSWKRRERWDEADAVERIGTSIEARLALLVAKDTKEGKDYKEIDLLGRQIERLARVRRYEGSGNEADLNPKVANRNSGPRRKAERNAIS